MVKKDLNALVDAGLLHPLADAMEWLALGNEPEPRPPAGYMISLIPIRERGVATPLHNFLHTLRHFYDAKLQHLNPNGI